MGSDAYQKSNGDDVETDVRLPTRRWTLSSCLSSARENVNVFVFFLCIYALIYGSIATYIVAMITTIEKRFDLSSSLSGLVMGTTEIGYLVAVLPISHYGVKGHRPRILGACGLLIAFSSILMAFPFFIYGYRKSGGGAKFNESDTGTKFCRPGLGPTMTTPSMSPLEQAAEAEFNRGLVLFFLLTGGVLYGIGCTPFFNIGVTFVDDHVAKTKSSFYFGILFCVRTIAPVFGFLIGGALAAYPENFFGTENRLPQDHPDFVGAWWVGFLIIGVLTGVTATPLLFFKSHLRRLECVEDSESSEEEEEAIEDMPRLKEKLQAKRFSVANPEIVQHDLNNKTEAVKSFFAALKRMITNPAVVLMTLGATIDYFTIAGSGTFIPKYFEVHFGQSPTTSNIAVGIASALFSALGTFLGGYLMTRTKTSMTRLMFYASIILGLLFFISIIEMFLSCAQVPLAGQLDASGQWGYSAPCNAPCGCSNSDFQPVCGANGLSYLSACAAGCADQVGRNFSGCRCVTNTTRIATAINGLCATACNTNFYIYIALSCVLSITLNICIMPFCMATLRCVHNDDKSLAMAILSFLSSLLAIPAPSIYGYAIDIACLFRSGADGGNQCLLYDRRSLRLIFHGMPSIARVLSVVLYFLTYLAAKRNVFMQINDKEMRKEFEKKAKKAKSGTETKL